MPSLWRSCTAPASSRRCGCRTVVTRRCVNSHVRGETAMTDLRRKRQQVSAFLLRQGLHYAAEKKTWTKAHMDWLAGQKLEHVEQRIVFEEMMLAVREAQARL